MYLLASGLKGQNMIPQEAVSDCDSTNEGEAECYVGSSNSGTYGFVSRGCTFWGWLLWEFSLARSIMRSLYSSPGHGSSCPGWSTRDWAE